MIARTCLLCFIGMTSIYTSTCLLAHEQQLAGLTADPSRWSVSPCRAAYKTSTSTGARPPYATTALASM